MLALAATRPQPRQLFGDTPAVLAEALQDGVNLAVWQRRLPLHITGFAETLLAQGEPLAESLTLEPGAEGELQLPTLAASHRDLAGHAGFVADVAWLARAFACLVDARRIGLRLRLLNKAMCPRFHVDHVPLRLITTYAGAGSEWLREGSWPVGVSASHQPSPPMRPLSSGCRSARSRYSRERNGKATGRRDHSSLAPCRTGCARLILTLDWLA